MRIGAIAWCFDGLHPWHMKILNFAKDLCDELYVFINDDEYIEKVKWHKPIYNVNERMEMLHLFWIENVWIFINQTSLKQKMIGCWVNVVFVWDDYVWKEVTKPRNALVIYFQRDEKYSTTNLIKRMQWEQ